LDGKQLWGTLAQSPWQPRQPIHRRRPSRNHSSANRPSATRIASRIATPAGCRSVGRHAGQGPRSGMHTVPTATMPQRRPAGRRAGSPTRRLVRTHHSSSHTLTIACRPT
jgi:hypothetical protein